MNENYKFWIVIFLFFVSCNNNKSIDNEALADYELNHNQQAEQYIVRDTIPKFVVDDYPISTDLLMLNRNSLNKIQSGLSFSYDKCWYSNDLLHQTIVFDLYTDFHRLAIFHFYSDDYLMDFIKRIEIHNENGKVVNEVQKQKDFNGFIKQSSKINSPYFTTEKGFKLGDSKQKAIDFYGEPMETLVNNDIEIYEWQFVGDEVYEPTMDLNNKPIAKNSFGHKIVMFFKNEILIGMIFYNDIP